MTTIDITTAIQTLTAEGYDREDIIAVIDSLIAAGVDHEDADGHALLTDGDMEVLRDQLDALNIPASEIAAGVEDADVTTDEMDNIIITRADGHTLVIGDEVDEDGNIAGYTWTVYSSQDTTPEDGETDGATNAAAAKRAIERFINA